MKIYVLDLLYLVKKEKVEEFGDSEILVNQIHFDSLSKAKRMANEWLNSERFRVNTDITGTLLASISYDEIDGTMFFEADEEELKRTGWVDGVVYDRDHIVWEKSVKVDGDFWKRVKEAFENIVDDINCKYVDLGMCSSLISLDNDTLAELYDSLIEKVEPSAEIKDDDLYRYCRDVISEEIGE